MNSCIELHDSWLERVVAADEGVRLDFSKAYIHKSEGRPGIDSGTGWVQPVQLFFRGGAWKGDFPKLPQYIMDGEFRIGVRAFPNELPIPLEATDAVSLELSFPTGESLSITGDGIHLALLGSPVFVEYFEGEA